MHNIIMNSLEFDDKELTISATDEPSDNEFAQLLQDSVFVDYFNTFLSLPIFGKRLLYNCSRETFEIDPPVKRTRYHLLHDKVKTWVKNNRAPLFLTTDLYIQFLLCKQLMANKEGTEDSDRRTYLGTVRGMRNFRVFLRGTRGERLFAFWMDAERFRRQVSPENRRFVFREIQFNYLKDGALYELPSAMKWQVTHGFTSAKIPERKPTILSTSQKAERSLFSQDIFLPMQRMVVERLHSYWVPQYIAHKEVKKKKTFKQWKLVVELAREFENSGDIALVRTLKAVTRMHGTKWSADSKDSQELSDIQEDETNSQEQTEETDVDTFLEMHRVSSTESVEEEKPDPEEEKRKRLVDWSRWFWGPVDNEAGKVVDVTLPRDFPDFLLHLGSPTVQKVDAVSVKEDTSSTPPPMSNTVDQSPDTTKTGLVQKSLSLIEDVPSSPSCLQPAVRSPGNSAFSRSSSSSPRASATPKAQIAPQILPEIKSSISGEPQLCVVDNKPKPMYAMITHSPRSRGQHMTLYEALGDETVTWSHEEEGQQEIFKESIDNDTTRKISTVEAVRKASGARIVPQEFLTASGFDYIFEKPRTAYPHTYLQQAYRLKENESALSLSAAIASDRLAGSPLMKHLQRNNDHKGIKHLQFWEDVQRYLVPTAVIGARNKYRMAKTLILTYLEPGSPRQIMLAPRMRRELLRLLPVDQADALLFKTAKHAVKALMEPWGEFAEIDIEHFLSCVTKPKTKSVAKADREAKRIQQTKIRFKKKQKGKTEEEKEEEKKLEQTADQRKSRVLEALGTATGVTLQDFDFEDEELEDNLEAILEMLKRRREIEMQMAQALASKTASARRGSHFYGQTKSKDEEKDAAKTSSKMPSIGKTRPPRPRNFQDVLLDPHQLLWFKRFLADHHSDAPLLFWQAVENMKNNTKDAKARQARSSIIVRKYFINISCPANEFLQCKAEIIREIPLLDKVTPPLLLSAQACVARSLEENWFIKYVATFPEDDGDSEYFAKYAMRNTLAGVCKIASYGKTRGLWVMFAQNIMSFQRGVHNPKSNGEFTLFLKKEHRTTVEHNTKRHSLHPNRRMINNKFVNTDRLVSDLEFWLEVEKFRGMADNATECAKAGNYNSDDEKIIMLKARTIIKCFINSELPPRVRINIPNDMAEQIVGLYENGIVERGLFHEASMSVFTGLIHFWKKFSAERDQADPTTPEGKDASKRGSTKKVEKRRISYICGLPYRRYSVGPDEDPRWSFSLLNGLRFIVPTPGKMVIQRRNTIRLPSSFRSPTDIPNM